MYANQFELKYNEKTYSNLYNFTRSLGRVLDIRVGSWIIMYICLDGMLTKYFKQNRIFNEEKEQDVQFSK